MTEEDLIALKCWFDTYTKSFYSSNEEDQKNIMLKIDHTHNVCRDILEIASGVSLDENQKRIAEAIALLHDIGRFPQYAKYKTFRDAASTSHGRLGANTLVEEKILCNLPDREQQIITRVVNFHGAFTIPSMFDEDELLFMKLIRDADKVDIFRVFLEYYESPEEDRASATTFGVPDTPEYSEVMISKIMEGQMASYSKIKTENDFRLMKLSWVYDIHFNESIRILQKRNYINRIIEMLPQVDEVKSAAACVQNYISERLSNDRDN